MRIRARFDDALRDPRRLFWLAWRTINLMLKGELLAAWGRTHPHGISRRSYHAWCRRHSTSRLASLRAIGRPPLPIVALVDCGDSSVNGKVAATLARQTLRCAAVLERHPDRRVSRVDGPFPPSAGAKGKAATLSACLDALEVRETWLLWITAPATLDEEFNASLAATVAVDAQAWIVYTDEDVLDAKGQRIDPVFKPAWDQEQILETNYLGPVVAMRATAALDLTDDAVPGPGGLWQALVRATWRIAAGRVVHVPEVLVHRWAEAGRTGVIAPDPHVAEAVREAAARRGATVEMPASGNPRLRYARLRDPDGVSIVIPTRDRGDLLVRCVDSLLANTPSPRFEIVIVDNGSVEADTQRCFRAIAARAPARVVAVPGSFNFPRLCNAGVAQARERIVTLLNNDTCIEDRGWLDELASLAQRPYTGAVGPLLLYEDGLVQTAGTLVGVNRIATNFLAGFARDDPIVLAWCRTRRRVSAVLGACLTVERAKYLAVGGMDERYAVSLNETDLCLRLEQEGFANVFTPFARLVHTEGATRGYDVEPSERHRLAVEERRFRANWGALLAQSDPAHNPNLRRSGNPLEIEFRSIDVAPRSGWRAALARGPSTVIPATMTG